METCRPTAQSGLTSAGLFTTGQNAVNQQANGALWRPWTKDAAPPVAHNMVHKSIMSSGPEVNSGIRIQHNVLWQTRVGV